MRKRLELARPFVESLYILCLKIEALYKNRLPQAEMRSVYAAFRAESARVGLGNKTIDEGMTLLDRLYDLLAVNGAERLAALKAASDLPGVKSTIKLVEERFTDEYFEPARVLYQWSRDVFSVSEGYASHILQSRDESVLNVTREKCQAAASSTQLVLAEILQAAVKAGYLVDEVKKLISEIRITISDEL